MVSEFHHKKKQKQKKKKKKQQDYDLRASVEDENDEVEEDEIDEIDEEEDENDEDLESHHWKAGEEDRDTIEGDEGYVSREERDH